MSSSETKRYNGSSSGTAQVRHPEVAVCLQLTDRVTRSAIPRPNESFRKICQGKDPLYVSLFPFSFSFLQSPHLRSRPANPLLLYQQMQSSASRTKPSVSTVCSKSTSQANTRAHPANTSPAKAKANTPSLTSVPGPGSSLGSSVDLKRRI